MKKKKNQMETKISNLIFSLGIFLAYLIMYLNNI